jgi:outer membrane protein
MNVIQSAIRSKRQKCGVFLRVPPPDVVAMSAMRCVRCLVAIAVLATAMVSSGAAPAETIESAMARAYQSNPQLNAQRAVVRQTDEGVAQALSGYRPTIGASASIGREYTDTTENFPPIPGTPLTQSTAVRIKGLTNPRSVGLNASQSIFNAKTPNQTRAAESQVFAARETLRVMEQSVLLSAATAYMDVLRDTANLEVQHSSVRVLQQMLKDTRDRRAVGEIPETDVAQAEAQLAGGEATLHAAEATLLATKANYQRIIGIEPGNLSPATPVDRLSPPSLSASLAQSIVENPSVTAAMYGVDVSQLQVKIAEAGLYPTLTLQGNVQKQYDANITTPKLFDSSVMLSLSIPIYQGGHEYSTIRQNKEAVGQQQLSLDQVRDQVRANVAQFWGQLDATKAETEATVRQVRASESALNGVRDEARVGQRTTLDVLNAQQALVNARLNLLTAQHDRVLASYNLLSAVGRLSAVILRLPVQVYDPAVHYHQVRDSWVGIRTPDGR